MLFSGRAVFVLTSALSRYYSSVQPLYESHEMTRRAPQGNEIRASERNSSKLMPQPAQIDHVQANDDFQDFEIFGVMKMLAWVFISRLFRNGQP